MEIKEFIEKFAEVIEVENVDALTAETEVNISTPCTIGIRKRYIVIPAYMIAFFDEEFEKEIGGTDIKKCDTIQDLFNLVG